MKTESVSHCLLLTNPEKTWAVATKPSDVIDSNLTFKPQINTAHVIFFKTAIKMCSENEQWCE